MPAGPALYLPDTPMIEACARIDAHCRRIGTPIGENATGIAATAGATGARLITTDRDFDRAGSLFRETGCPRIRRRTVRRAGTAPRSGDRRRPGAPARASA